MAHADRGAELTIRCGCGCKSPSWIIHARWQRGQIRDEVQRIVAPTEYHERCRHPHLFFQNTPAVYRQDYSILSLTTRSDSDATETLTFTAELRNDGNHGEIDVPSRKALESIGIALHQCIVSHGDKYATAQSAYAGARTVTEIEADDTSVLRTFVHCLATGRPFVMRPQEDGDRGKERRMYNCSMVATDLICSAGSNARHGSKLKDFISDHLNVAAVSRRIIDILCVLGLARSRTYNSLAKDRAVDGIIRDGFSPVGKGYGIVMKAFDNMGMKKKAGYVQFTLMMILCMSVHKLIQLNIYPDPTNKNIEEAKRKCLSRDSLSWLNVRLLEPGHQDYFDPAPSKDDGLMMARSVTLPSIQFVLESMENGSMYKLEQAKRCVEQHVFKKDSLHTVSHGPGGRIVRKDGEEDDMVVSAAETPIPEEDINNINNLDDSDVEDDSNQTMYARNGVVSDIPLKLDLNEHTTVKLLIDSVEDLRKRCLDGTSTIGINAQGEVEAQGPSLDPDDIKGNPWSDNEWPVEDWPIPWMVDLTLVASG